MEGKYSFNKHADGENWWIVDPVRANNIFAVFFVDSTGVAYHHEQQIGLKDTVTGRGFEQTIFSPKGDLYLRHSATVGTRIFDFDRETGELSNFRRIPPPPADPETYQRWGSGGIAVSPNGRFIYTCNQQRVYQYDLWADDLTASEVIIANLDGRVIEEGRTAASIISFQLGPDCNIYGFGNQGDEVHVIHSPNEKGAACEWEVGGLKLPTGMFRDEPYYPNYRLGPLGKEGMPCTEPTVSSDDPAEENTEHLLTISPNPSGGAITIELDRIAGLSELTWVLYDAAGRDVRHVDLSLPGQSSMTVQREGLIGGLYLWKLVGAGRVLDSGKLVFK